MWAPLEHRDFSFRTLLVLGRVSNLPTVWSNCLAGWLLGGGGSIGRLLGLALGASFIYLGGMFLNDACDRQFDAQHRRERPIPSGAISPRAVWWWSVFWLAGGLLVLGSLGRVTAVLAALLVALIVIYDLVHKVITFSTLLVGGCRFLLYLVAASVAGPGVSGLAVWSGFALAAYIIGLSYLARVESTGSPFPYGPLLLLATPIGLALIVNGPGYRRPAMVLSILLALWTVRCLRFILGPDPKVGHAVSGLLAGIVLVDLLAVADQPLAVGAIFLLLFGLAQLLQRFVPAT